MRGKILNHKGQTLIEFLTVLPLLIALLSGTAFLFQSQWDQFRCSYWVYRKTHTALMNLYSKDSNQEIGQVFFASLLPSSYPQNLRVRTDDQKTWVEGVATCGIVKEKIRLFSMEALVGKN